MGEIKVLAGEQICKGRTKAGMQYVLYPKKQSGESMAAIVVPYGSNGIQWQKKGTQQKETFPLGIAHFIEHKLFAQKWGDAFGQFAKQGAEANAFTDRERTVYYFTCRSHFIENLQLLLDFVQHPYFTAENVEQEKSIIQSEIKMYADWAEWVAYEQMLDLLYPSHLAHKPVAGTLESVAETTVEDLQRVYDACYLPQDFMLICAGNINTKQVMEAAEGVMCKEKTGDVLYDTKPCDIQKTYQEKNLSLRRPVFQIGFWMEPRKRDCKEKLAMDILLDLLAGESSPFFAQAYAAGYLDTPMGRGYFVGDGYTYCTFSGSSTEVEKIAALLLTHWKKLQQQGIAQMDFERLQKKQIGQNLRLFQSVSSIGMAQMDFACYGADLEEVFRLTKELKQNDIEKLLQNTIMQDKMVLSVVR